jgi:hypothetical protein
MFWDKVSLVHCHLYVRMADYLLQHENITADHHKVRCEGVA